MKKESNYYEYLRMPGIIDEDFNRNDSTTSTIYFSESESILLQIDNDCRHRYIIGYNIHFSNGRNTVVSPTIESGYFNSYDEAKLYFLGYIKTYESYFSQDCINTINCLLMQTAQTSLF